MSPELGYVWSSDASRAITHYASGTQKARSRWLAPTAACAETKQQLPHSKQQMTAAFEVSGPRSLFFLLSILPLMVQPILNDPRSHLLLEGPYSVGPLPVQPRLDWARRFLSQLKIFWHSGCIWFPEKNRERRGGSFTLQSK